MAKKSKPVKKAVPKKVVAKKAIVKKVVKKAPQKKAVVKKAVPKKVAAKKAVVKPASPKVKKAIPAKVAARKPAAKKAIAIKKSVPVKPSHSPLRTPAKVPVKKAVIKKEAVAAPSVKLLPDGFVENAANINKQMMVPGDGLDEAPVKTEDPVKTFDKNVFNKATAKGDPHSNMQLSSKPKNAIKPSGKKPLW